MKDSNMAPFSQSPIWELQRQYYKEMSVKAWRDGDVPHYITSNAQMASTYADLIWAFLLDNAYNEYSGEPVYIIELGTGSGRFSYHLLKALTSQHSRLTNFIYVMTDFVEETVQFWESHPRLQPFFESGQLDIALFDAGNDNTLYLRKSGYHISSAQKLKQPIITIANYFFDSIPQELFYIDKGEMGKVLSEINGGSIESDEIDTKEALEGTTIKYYYEHIEQPVFETPVYNILLDHYRTNLSQSHLLFPKIGLDCIMQLKNFSSEGLMLLTADKGYHRLEEWNDLSAPYIAKHGSFSLLVNYNAIKMHCESLGGAALFPTHYHESIDVGCLLYLTSHDKYLETKSAYNRVINDFGPDEYFSVKKHIEKNVNELSVTEMFTYLRLSKYDAKLFHQFLPCFYHILETFTTAERHSFLQISAKVWDGFYPIGEDLDLALDIGLMLKELHFFNEALSFFELSEHIYGMTMESLYNKALCFADSGFPEIADRLMAELKVKYPGYMAPEEIVESMLSR